MLTGQIFIQLLIILLAVQVFGYLGQWVGQPKVIGEILAGLALGPTLLGAVLQSCREPKQRYFRVAYCQPCKSWAISAW